MCDSLRHRALCGHYPASLGFGCLAGERIERTVLLSSVALASASVCWGIRIHCQRRILVVFRAALSLILAGRGYAKDALVENGFGLPGAALFVFGHLLNRHLCPTCRKCGHD